MYRRDVNRQQQEPIISLSREKQTILVTLYYLGVRRIGVSSNGQLQIVSSKKNEVKPGQILGEGYSLEKQFCLKELLVLENPSNLLLGDLLTKYCDEYHSFYKEEEKWQDD